MLFVPINGSSHGYTAPIGNLYLLPGAFAGLLFLGLGLMLTVGLATEGRWRMSDFLFFGPILLQSNLVVQVVLDLRNVCTRRRSRRSSWHGHS